MEYSPEYQLSECSRCGEIDACADHEGEHLCGDCWTIAQETVSPLDRIVWSAIALGYLIVRPLSCRQG